MPPNVGRGGWTWYTGSAAWMYRTAMEYMLGIRLQGDTLTIDPVIPSSWPRFDVTFRHGDSIYEISVENPTRRCKGVASIVLDDLPVKSGRPEILLVRDGKVHNVRVTLGLVANAKESVH